MLAKQDQVRRSGWARLKSGYQPAWPIRRRYTVFDRVEEAAFLDTCMDTLFTPGHFWTRETARLARANNVH
jgi:hypothetical protein